MDNHDDGTRYLINVYSLEVSTLSGSQIKPGSRIDVALGPEADLETLRLTTKLCRECAFANQAPKGTNQQGKFFLTRVPMWKTLAFGLTCFILGATFWKAPSTETIKNVKKIATAVGEIAAEIKDMAAYLES